MFERLMTDKIEKKIFVDENIHLIADSLNVCGEVTAFNGRKLSNNELCKRGCTSLFVRSTTKVNEKLLRGSDVSFVGSSTSGFDHIEVDYLNNEKIHFAYAPGSNANSVAEYVVYSILKWSLLTESQLTGKTIGIVGYGNIGKLVEKYSVLLGLNVFVNDPPLRVQGYEFPGNVKYAELEELCSKSDMITSHVPLTFEGEYPTYKLFNDSITSMLKNNSLFIHTSRGGVADESFLLNIIKSRNVKAVVDVWENEPLINTGLAKRAMLSTPHIAGYSRDGKIRGALMMAKEYEKYSDTKPDYTVFEEELSMYKPLPKEKYIYHNELFELLKNSRKLDDDDSALRATLELEVTEKAEAFDSLRKNYPLRREIL